MMRMWPCEMSPPTCLRVSVRRARSGVMRASGSRSDGAGFSTIGRSEGAVAVMGEVQLIMGLKEEEEEEEEEEEGGKDGERRKGRAKRAGRWEGRAVCPELCRGEVELLLRTGCLRRVWAERDRRRGDASAGSGRRGQVKGAAERGRRGKGCRGRRGKAKRRFSWAPCESMRALSRPVKARELAARAGGQGAGGGGGRGPLASPRCGRSGHSPLGASRAM